MDKYVMLSLYLKMKIISYENSKNHAIRVEDLAGDENISDLSKAVNGNDHSEIYVDRGGGKRHSGQLIIDKCERSRELYPGISGNELEYIDLTY